MNLAHITNDDWNDFEKQFPDAHSFLLRRSLWNEYWYYRTRKAPLNEWEQKRLEELSKFFNL